ncbi:MAG: FkbM family methyltransferase [Candidatus Wallbacteria bacterium]|nr:FkbM family methyltransferase [Candidatus Wallbacteria bacterium]
MTKKQKLINRIARSFFNLLPQRSCLLYRASKKYLDRYNNDNNDDMQSNGELAFLKQELSVDTGIVFDVGANVGDWAKLALEINSKISLHCFEPSSATFDILKNNSFPPNVFLNNVGLGDTSGELELQIAGEGSGANSIYQRRGVLDNIKFKAEKITVLTLDDYCSTHNLKQIDFLKIDVEGHELAVFKGMREMLKKGQVKVIQFEYGGSYLDARIQLGDIWELFSSLDYSFYKIFPAGPERILKYSQDLETFQYSNWVIRHNQHFQGGSR